MGLHLCEACRKAAQKRYDMGMKHQIYLLIDERCGEPFYIGSTTQPLENRLSQHKYNAKIATNLKAERIREIHESGGTVSIQAVCSADTVEHARKLESEAPQECNTHYGRPLRSKLVGYQRSDENRQAVSNGLKRYYKAHPISRRDTAARRWIVVHPNGAEEEVLNLRQFAKSNNLPCTLLYDAARRNTTTRQGYRVLPIALRS